MQILPKQQQHAISNLQFRIKPTATFPTPDLRLVSSTLPLDDLTRLGETRTILYSLFAVKDVQRRSPRTSVAHLAVAR